MKFRRHRPLIPGTHTTFRQDDGSNLHSLAVFSHYSLLFYASFQKASRQNLLTTNSEFVANEIMKQYMVCHCVKYTIFEHMFVGGSSSCCLFAADN